MLLKKADQNCGFKVQSPRVFNGIFTALESKKHPELFFTHINTPSLNI